MSDLIRRHTGPVSTAHFLPNTWQLLAILERLAFSPKGGSLEAGGGAYDDEAGSLEAQGKWDGIGLAQLTLEMIDRIPECLSQDHLSRSTGLHITLSGGPPTELPGASEPYDATRVAARLLTPPLTT